MAKLVVCEPRKVASKSLLISIIDETGVPEYNFIGNWVGKDISLVAGLLTRAYHKHVKKLRAQGISITNKEE